MLYMWCNILYTVKPCYLKLNMTLKDLKDIQNSWLKYMYIKK